MYRAALIIPVFNEEKQIYNTLKHIDMKKYHVICVDDGSSDSSSLEIRKTKARLIKHPINLGQGASLQTGIEYALQNPDIQYFVTFDADGQHRVEDVEKMLDKIKAGKFDIILGSRFLGDTVNMPILKKIILKYAVKFANFTSGVNLTDTHNGLRVFTREVAEKLDLQMADYSHASEIIEKIGALKLKYTEVPVTIEYTEYSKSKGQSMINAVNIGFDILLDKVMGR
jgi:glycosyltransferase involved in cell wall biosynthesis